jgi:amidase
LDPAGRAAIDAVVAALEEAGHTVVRKDLVVTPATAFGAVARWLAGADADAEALGLDRAAMEPRSRTHARLGRWVRRAGLVRPRTVQAFQQRMAGFFTDVDLLLTPVVSGPPLAARPWHERGFLANITANARWAPWTSAWNLAGLPALVLPAGPGREGLPSSVQFVGPAGSETRLLWLAGELERRLPWRRHAPVFDPTEPAGTVPG